MTQKILPRGLLMDDNRVFAIHLVRELRRHGFELETYPNATLALTAFEERTFDFVVADIIVLADDKPVPDGGLILIHRLRAAERERGSGTDLKVVAISGAIDKAGMGNLLTTAEGLGADASLVKPFEVEELVETLRDLGIG
ncbi:MAG: response regulator [Marinovum sp.]|nr:response regulator [Marinovum sp.]